LAFLQLTVAEFGASDCDRIAVSVLYAMAVSGCCNKVDAEPFSPLLAGRAGSEF
jgi:hypothetical protein